MPAALSGGKAIRAAGALVLGYALGNLPSADVATRLAGRRAPKPDLRSVGSANPGALNAARELGQGWGAAVLVADTAKGAVAAAAGRRIAGPNVANLAATAAIIGHCYPASGRSGGKGVATSVGQVIGTFPRYLPLDAVVAAATAALPRWTQRTWSATAVASTVWVASSFTAWIKRWPTGTDDPAPAALPVAAAVSSAVIAFRFRAQPLIDGKPDRRPSDDDQAGDS